MEKTGIELLTLVAILSSISGLNDAIRCLSCDHVSSPLDCNRIRTCESYEECVTELKVSASGVQYYRLGCEPKVNCGSGGSSAVIGRKREQENNITERYLDGDLTACSHCCNSSDGCNIKLCTTKTTNLLRCLQCNNVLRAEDCQEIAQCDIGELCYMNADHYSFSGIRTSLGCMWPGQCRAIADLNPTRCITCCTTDYCNYDVCKNFTAPTHQTYTVAPTTKTPLHKPEATCVKSPVTTSYTINCHVTGNPQPTVYWTFYDDVECVTELKVSASGVQYYRLGCEPKVNCGSGGSSAVVGRKREQENNITARNLNGDLTACSHCCNSSDGCNIKLCTTKTMNYLRCLKCDDVLRAEDCQEIAECGDGERCFTFEGYYNLGGRRTQMGCMGQLQCNAIALVHPHDCFKCCTTDYCNYDACKNFTAPTYPTYTQAPTTKPPPTTTKPPLQKPEATCVKSPVTTSYAINCHVTGNPQPTVYWTFYDDVHSVYRQNFNPIKDPDVVFHHNLTNYVLYVGHYNPLRHNGDWYFHASNVYGHKQLVIRIP